MTRREFFVRCLAQSSANDELTIERTSLNVFLLITPPAITTAPRRRSRLYSPAVRTSARDREWLLASEHEKFARWLVEFISERPHIAAEIHGHSRLAEQPAVAILPQQITELEASFAVAYRFAPLRWRILQASNQMYADLPWPEGAVLFVDHDAHTGQAAYRVQRGSEVLLMESIGHCWTLPNATERTEAAFHKHLARFLTRVDSSPPAPPPPRLRELDVPGS